MKAIVFAGLVLSFASVVACSSETGSPEAPTLAAQPTDGADREAGDEQPKPAVKPQACSTPRPAPTCAETKPAPKSPSAIEKFVKDSAVPLRCGDSEETAVWDLRALVDLYGKQKIFMMGEVHGSNEIGILSSLVFEELAKKKLVDVLAFELPMDFESSLQRYIDTGKDAVAEQILRHLAPNMFGRILTKTARELVVGGIKLRIAAVDIPMSPQTAVAAIEDVATKLTTQKDTVLATLPADASEPPTDDDIARVNAYFDHITSKKTEVCAELSAPDCDRLVAMTHALWAATLVYDRQGDSELWFERREEVIYYNLRTKMTAPSDRMFLHMGAAHTNKHTFSAGSRMTKEYALTKDQVFSVAPAFGEGSVIWYGRDVELPAEPASIAGALSDEPAHPYFVSTTRPGESCEANPVGEEPEQGVGGGSRRELYDGYVHYGKLTSERRPSETTFSRDNDVVGGASSVSAFRARIEQRESEAIAAGVFSRRRGLRR